MRSHDAVPADVTSLLDNLDKVRVDNNPPCSIGSVTSSEAEFITYKFVEVFGHNLESSQNLRFPYTIFTTTIQFQTTFAH